MKIPSFIAASVAAAAASATAISASSSSSSRQEGGLSNDERQIRPAEKFAPRFDGLRFIETLVTAHR